MMTKDELDLVTRVAAEDEEWAAKRPGNGALNKIAKQSRARATEAQDEFDRQTLVGLPLASQPTTSGKDHL